MFVFNFTMMLLYSNTNTTCHNIKIENSLTSLVKILFYMWFVKKKLNLYFWNLKYHNFTFFLQYRLVMYIKLLKSN